ncbi:hypothetical protein GBF35_38500 [Nonomuraea phyllanthi]|uniref:hypothetical protein n=1 Tax=Nonomuraea phyllanthi TaxID=2219224 RepID=UPI001293D9F7|nr:hypothetical protein [Nonomuraea phyllanthi]QFY11692.1 hypothetical protein GBF35_38500 [Nonomuraea phyllanthi]
MATENSGPHLPPSWPEAPRPANQDPSWPEPPRKDDSWPEPPRRPRHQAPQAEPARPEAQRARQDASGPSSWPDLPPAQSSWPDSSPQGNSGPSSWPDSTSPGNAGPSSWPDASLPGGGAHPGQDTPPRGGAGPSSWPDASPQGGAPAWPDAPRRDTGRTDPPRQDVPMSWPDASSPEIPTSWPEASPPQGGPDPSSWPDTPPQGFTGGPQGRGNHSQGQGNPQGMADHPQGMGSLPNGIGGGAPQGAPDRPGGAAGAPQRGGGPAAWPDAPPQGQGSRAGDRPQVPDPVPAWAQPPAQPAGSWPDVHSPGQSPGPWPASDRNADASPADRTAMYQVDDLPQGAHAPPRNHPADERTVTYAQHSANLLNDRAVPSSPTMDSSHPSTAPTPPAEDQNGAPRPGSNLNRDPSDPDRPFVTAGQISGSRTPPPERQQELWNTVFGDNYQAMGEQDPLDEEQGKPIWIYALGGSVAVALVIALLWAFLAGPLAGEDPQSSTAAAEQTATPPPSTPPTKASSIGPLPKYAGKPAPVVGRLTDAAAGISLPRLGGTWRLDQRATMKSTYGYETRQYVLVTEDTAAQVMSGPLPQKLASYYEQDNLEPVIRQVVLDARKRFFPDGNKVKKIAQQAIKVGDSTGRLIAYALTSPTEKATIVTMAVNTGGDVPAIVYISIPPESKQLMPDVRTVMNQLKLNA